MKALKDFKDERLSKQEMGNVVGGILYCCSVVKGEITTVSYHEFNPVEMSQWVADKWMEPGVTFVRCLDTKLFEGMHPMD
ncbi:MAG: hypothetical protein IAB93_00435 [Bacteroidetes bacterium]|uniref:Uncharacterized protein n=1 Tax=Candidatus Merdivivens pullistercoris TaxID=2840873 RepID=A0A9D9N8L4_9BACT|nr:hypothetical protein [Candidatus Merdivivens pullistercoris]